VIKTDSTFRTVVEFLLWKLSDTMGVGVFFEFLACLLEDTPCCLHPQTHIYCNITMANL